MTSSMVRSLHASTLIFFDPVPVLDRPGKFWGLRRFFVPFPSSPSRPIPRGSCAWACVFRGLVKRFCAETWSARAFSVHFGEFLEQLLQVS